MSEGNIIRSFLGFMGLIINLLSFGKYNKTEKQIKLLEVKNKSIHKNLEPFEEAAIKYYKNLLEHFFQNNLYRKRSGNKRFEESLSQFSSIIDEIYEINGILVTGQEIPLLDYMAYLFGRRINHSYQKDKEKVISSPFSKILKGIKERSKPEKPIPPEVLYATPRKIDWEKVNKKRMVTGAEDMGMEILCLYRKTRKKTFRYDYWK